MSTILNRLENPLEFEIDLRLTDRFLQLFGYLISVITLGKLRHDSQQLHHSSSARGGTSFPIVRASIRRIILCSKNRVRLILE